MLLKISAYQISGFWHYNYAMPSEANPLFAGGQATPLPVASRASPKQNGNQQFTWDFWLIPVLAEVSRAKKDRDSFAERAGLHDDWRCGGWCFGRGAGVCA